MIFQDFLENRVAKKIQEQNTNILQSLSSENSDTIQMEGREFELFLKKREIEFLIEYFFAKHLSQMMLRFGEDIISNKLIFMPILKGGVYLEILVTVFRACFFPVKLYWIAIKLGPSLLDAGFLLKIFSVILIKVSPESIISSIKIMWL